MGQVQQGCGSGVDESGGRASPGQALGPPTGNLRTYPGGTQ